MLRLQSYGDKVRFIYRHYNVGFTYSGVTAKLAEAAYVAGGEDAYWKMQDRIFGDSEWVQGAYMDDAALDDKIRSTQVMLVLMDRHWLTPITTVPIMA